MRAAANCARWKARTRCDDGDDAESGHTGERVAGGRTGAHIERGASIAVAVVRLLLVDTQPYCVRD